MEARQGDGLGGVRSGRVSCAATGRRLLTRRWRRSAADEISGETVAIKLITRVFEKVQLAKRALREITLLRHFANHENITGMIDVDAISPDFQEMCVVFVLVHVVVFTRLVVQIHLHGGELCRHCGV